MEVTSEMERIARTGDFAAADAAAEAVEDKKARSNKGFTQVYQLGWARISSLIEQSPAAARIYAYLAQHIDGACGAVVVSQAVMADDLGLSTKTIMRQTKFLEDNKALVRLTVGTGVYAYALDPREVWKSWDDHKATAAFVTRTLVKKSDRANQAVRRKLKVMIGEGADQ